VPLVLIADDDADVRDAVADMVRRRAGARVVEAVDGADALAIAVSSRPDLVLTDWMMPRLNGAELLAALRADPATEEVPVVLFSAYVNPGMSAGLGFDGYLPKPVRLAALQELLERFLPMATRPG
jgi:CheY-like chemotaxis protein